MDFETWQDVLDYWKKVGCEPLERLVVCAVVKTKCGKMITGARHGHCFYQGSKVLGFDMSQKADDQGFIDQFNVYMDRKEAYRAAKEAAQLIPDRRDGRLNTSGILFSEDLY